MYQVRPMPIRLKKVYVDDINFVQGGTLLILMLHVSIYVLYKPFDLRKKALMITLLCYH